MNSFLLKFCCILLIPVFFVACDKHEPEITEQEQFLKLGESVSSGSAFKVEFFTKDSLFVGYNKLYFKITDQSSGLLLKQATLSLRPLMDMISFKHACPVEDPGYNSDLKGYFDGAVLFSMVGIDSWTLSVDVLDGGKTETVVFPIHKVRSTVPVKKIVVIDSLKNEKGEWILTKYPISLVEPSKWKVGNNVFEITIHTMASQLSFPFCSDLTVEITPEMPSMGHGSPNNINPVHISNGHYKGTVNFTMSGDWRIHMTIKKGEKLITDKAWFDIVF